MCPAWTFIENIVLIHKVKIFPCDGSKFSTLHGGHGGVALDITERPPGLVARPLAADVEPHDPARVEVLHEREVVPDAAEVAGVQLAPEAEADHPLAAPPRLAAGTAQGLGLGPSGGVQEALCEIMSYLHCQLIFD